MEEKAKHTMITKLLGIFMICYGIICFYGLFEIENISFAIWCIVYIIFIPIGGLLNLFDFGKISPSMLACFSYSICIVLRILFDITISGEVHVSFYLILTVAFLISIFRYLSIHKVETSKTKDFVLPLKSRNEERTYTIDVSQPKCKVGIMREARMSGSGSLFIVYVDGVNTTTIRNGGATRLILTPGQHIIGFGRIGVKILGSITLNLSPGSDTNIVCRTKGSGIEVIPTSVDVCALAGSTPSLQPQSNGSGCLIAILVVLLLFALGIFSIRFTFFLVPIR